MVRRRLRAALAAAVAAPLLIGPVGAQAVSAPLSCGEQTGLWQRVPVRFPAVPSVQTRPDPTAYAVDEQSPQRVLVTNGTVVLADDRHGCDLRPALVLGAQPSADVPLSGTTSTVVATAFLPRGRALALVREGTGAASRPHVVASPTGEPGSWQLSDAGLPLQGNPRLLVPAGDGRTAYLVLTPSSDAGSGGGPLGALPGGPSAPAPAGLLYASTDAGASWSLRTPVSALPSGVTGVDALAVDPRDPELLYALSGGRLVVSRDGGRSLSVSDAVADATALTTMAPGELAVLRDKQLLLSTDAGVTFQGRPAPPAPRSAAYRAGDPVLVVESGSRLSRVDTRKGGGITVLDAGVPALPGSSRGDRATDGSFHALAADFLLRYVDPRAAADPPPPPPVGDVPPPPPPPGTISPARQAVSLPVGTSRIVPLELRLKRSPTPTDVYLLLDVSSSMTRVIEDLKDDFSKFVTGVQDEGISLRVGLATVGSGKREGEPPYSERPTDPNYRKPVIYEQQRAIGPIDAQLAGAVRAARVQTCINNECNDSQEGQLLALREMLHGDGITSERSTPLLLDYLVEPGQDAGFSNTRGVRKVAVLASDDEFEAPFPTPTGDDGEVEPSFVDEIAAELRTAGVSFVGLAATPVGGGSAAAGDMQRLARLVGTEVPPGGVDCGQGVQLPAGAPLVCDGASDIGPVLTRLVQSLADRQTVTLSARGAAEVIGSLDASRLRDLDVTVPTAAPFLARVSCVDLPPGTRTAQVDASLRGFRVATGTLDVTCTPAAVAAAVPPKPEPPAVQDPAPPAQPAQAPPAPAPAPPVVQAQAQAQVQSQVQTQAQVQPLTAAALQQQEELQLALALLADEKTSPGSELAMVDRRRSEELRALALLSVSMGAASALGVARLRARRGDGVRVQRVR